MKIEHVISRQTNQIRIATESFEQSETNIKEYASKYGYDAWRIRVMDMQRSSVNFLNPVGRTDLDSATLLFQANGYSFSTAHNTSLDNITSKLITPYSVKIKGNRNNLLRNQAAQLLYNGKRFHELENIKLYDIMPAVSSWYFERREFDGTPLPEKVFVNPVLGCALRCKSCSRIRFLNKPLEYVDNLERITNEISANVIDKSELKVVNISTGTLPTVGEDFELFKAVINSFRHKGFNEARFSIQTSTIFDESQLLKLRALGVDRFSVTMDGTSNEVLKRIYRGKGPLTVGGYSEMVMKLENIFPKVGVHLILGHDSIDTIKRTTEILANQGKAAIHHYIPRIFIPGQYNILHTEAKNMGLEYYVTLKRFIDDLNDARMPKMDLLNPFYGLQPNEFTG